MKKSNKNETANLFLSAFLIIAYIICVYFFTQFTSTIDPTLSNVISVVLYALFGLLLFYATRVGDGKAVKRFSPVTLIIMVLPTLYIIIASFAPGLPFNDIFASSTDGISGIVLLASVALGYGLPYSFLSGFELKRDEDVQGEEQAEVTVLEGGVEADISNDNNEPEVEDTEAELAQQTTEDPDEQLIDEESKDELSEDDEEVL